jgi:flagellar basal-body rod protein FlgB
MISRIDAELHTSQTALNLRAYRQELLASNIANADTPNYKARDIDFKAALGNALGNNGTAGVSGGQLAPTRTSPRHLQADGVNAYAAAVLYRTEQQSAVDGNTVNMDVERSNFAENAVQVEALLTFVRRELGDLNTAITG